MRKPFIILFTALLSTPLIFPNLLRLEEANTWASGVAGHVKIITFKIH